jgi:hypothetical protein
LHILPDSNDAFLQTGEIKWATHTAPVASVAKGAEIVELEDDVCQSLSKLKGMQKSDGEVMQLKVKGQDGSFVHFKMKKTTVLKGLMQEYCMRKGLEISRICFLFRHSRLSETQTPAELYIWKDDAIFFACKTLASLLASDALAAVLGAVPSDDWCRALASLGVDEGRPNRTMVLRMTSKRVKDALDKLRPPTTAILSRAFWQDVRNGNEVERLEHILAQLEKMASRCRITRLVLQSGDYSAKPKHCGMTCQDAGRLAGVLVQCPGLFCLELGINQIGDEGAARLAVALSGCSVLSTLNLSRNQIGKEGARRLAEVLPKCPALSMLILGYNRIGPGGAGRLAGVLSQCQALHSLDLCSNQIGDEGAGWLAGVLPQCPKLTNLRLNKNRIANAGVKALAGVLPQCPKLFMGCLDLSDNWIGDEGLLSLREADPSFHLGQQDTGHQQPGTFDMILEELWASMEDGGY